MTTGRMAVVVGMATLASGCLTTSYKTGLPGNGEMHTDSASYHVWGLVGDKTLDLGQLCPNGVSQWKDHFTVGDWLITCIACGGLIYASKTIEVECAGSATAAKTSYLLVPDPGHHETVVIPMGSAQQKEGHS
jgi:hypothetical protein